MEKMRLQKYFTDCNIMSRRAAEAEIAAGHVTVNGRTAEVGQSVTPGVDAVEYKGKKIEYDGESRHTYIMLNKPSGYVTTLSDEKSRPTARSLIDISLRIYPVGRLDMYSEGLLIFTDDGELTNALTHPSGDVSKLYHAMLRGHIVAEQIEKLSRPMTIDDYELRPVKVSLLRYGETKTGAAYTAVSFTLHEGRNRQIRKMCEQSGLCVLRLRRVAIGDVKLGNLPSGAWRYLHLDEINSLKKAAGICL